MTLRPKFRPSWYKILPVQSEILSSFELCTLSSFGVLYRDNFLTRDEARLSRSQAEKIVGTQLMRPAAVGRGSKHHIDPKTRGDNIAWLDKQSGFQAYFRKLELLKTELNRTAYLGLNHYEVQCSVHQSGSAGFKRHSDTFRDQGVQRRLTTLYYMNPNWKDEDGGVLQVHLPDTTILVEPRDNRFVVFLSDLEHEVTAVNKKRLALTAWFYSGRSF